MALNEEQNSLFKLAQFYAALRKNIDSPYLERVVDQIDNINCQIPMINHIGNHKPELIGSTLLHLAQREDNDVIFEYLLNRGIDYTLQNISGSTALLQPIEDIREKSPTLQIQKLIDCLSSKYTHLILSAHINQNNYSNPCNYYGISHFHVACLMNKATVVQFFLENSVLIINQTISFTSPILPGYSPLHLAITSDSLNTIKVLLKYKAKINCKDARGKTPLHILIERRLEVVKLLADPSDYRKEAFQMKLQMIDNRISLLLTDHNTFKIDDINLTHLHVACILPCTPQLQQFAATIKNVDQAIKMDSPFFPGYTPLHFAILFDSDLAMSLLRKGANIHIKDANGKTPLDICLQRYNIEKVHLILSSVPGYCNILMSDGRTRFLYLLDAMRSIDTFNHIIPYLHDLNIQVPVTSPLFPGMSILHLAVIFSKERKKSYPSQLNFDIIKMCLQRKAYLYAVDSQGLTPLHLAFRLHKIYTLDILLKHNFMELSSIPIHYRGFFNTSDGDNLSISHIAAAADDFLLVDKLLSNSIFDINCPVLSNFKWFENEPDSICKDKDHVIHIPKNSTLLHIAMATWNIPMTELLLERGADIYAKDINGLTPIHHVLIDGHKLVGNALLSIPNIEDRVVIDANLSHLHVACYLNKVSVVERLVNSGSDIEAAITCTSEAFASLSHLDGCTPIHIAMKEENFEVIRYLLERDANILARKPDGSTPLYQNLMNKSTLYLRKLLSELWGKKELLKYIEDDTGLTILHLACYLVDLELVRYSLKHGVNVNSRVRINSPIWPGCTPLHILATHFVKVIDHSLINNILKLLLSRGADVSVLDIRRETPIHFVNTLIPNLDRRSVSISPSMSFVIYAVNEIFSSINDFTANSRNDRGITLFHIACRICHVEAMNKYLERGCDVNQQIDYYSCNRFAGYTPLHLLMSSPMLFAQNLRAFELLLNYDADCNLKDIYGNTPLHILARFNDVTLRANMLLTFISKGANANLQNLFGETPFEIVLKSPDTTAKEVKFLLDSGCLANSFNPITGQGYLPHTFNNMEILDILLNSNKIHDTYDQGRTAIHNIVSVKKPMISKEEYFTMIQKLVKLGCDLDHQDQLGKTALHLAVQFYNYEAIFGLLIAGADINILDGTGNSAVSYYSYNPSAIAYEILLDRSKSKIQSTLAFHLHKLRFLNLHVIQQNIEQLERYCQQAPIDVDRLFHFSEEIRKVESLHLGSTSMSLRNLLSENGIVIAAYIPKRLREDINEFFENGISQYRFQEIESVLRLQYQKIIKRRNMIESAVVAIQEIAKISFKHSSLGNASLIFYQNDLFRPCCERILGFLSNRDVDNLITSTKYSIH